MEFRILGPVEVVATGGGTSGSGAGGGGPARVVAIRAARHRAVLAALLLEANRHVARGALIDQIWNAAPPESAVGTLQSYVSRLRTALRPEQGGDGAVALVSGREGRTYRLRVDPDQVDAMRFERLVGVGRDALAAGSTDQAETAFGQALSLWRDRPLADLADTYDFAAAAARRLTALRATAQEGLFRAVAGQGRLPGVVDQVQRACAEHPGHSGLRELEMLALHQAGRTTDALSAYHDFRRVRGESGLDPERALTALEQRILRQDPGLAAAPPAPGLIGRDAQLARLRSALDAAGTGRGRVVLVHGDAGIGKSMVAGCLAEEAAGAGVLVGVGSPLGTDGAPAFRPWIQALGAIGAREARALLVEWTADAPGGPDTRAREHQFDAVTRSLARVAAERGAVLLLDDLHDADAPSLRLLEHVARRLHGTRLLILGLARHTDAESHPGADGPGADGLPVPDTGGGWSEALRRVRRVAGVEHLVLTPLDDAAVGELVAFELGRVPGETLLTEVTGRARGNPLFAAELTRLLGDERVLTGLRDRGGRLPTVPPLVHETVRDRAGRLPPACRELLALAAVLGFEFELAVLSVAATQLLEAAGAADIDELLAPALERRFLEPVPGNPGRLRFHHPLVHEALEDQLTPGRHETLHRRAAEAVETVHGAWSVPHAERLAAHWRSVTGAAPQARSLEYAFLAGRQARTVLAWEEAVRVLSLALDDAGELPPARHAELLVELGDALMSAGEAGPGGRVLLQAADLARRLGDGRLLARAALGVGESDAFLGTCGPDVGIGLLDAALRMSDQDEGDADGVGLRVRLLACLATTLVWAKDNQTPANRGRRDRLSAEALALARDLGDGRGLARTLSARIAATWSPGNPEQRLALAEEGLTAAVTADARDMIPQARRNRAVACLELGDLAGFRAEARLHAAAADELRQPHHQYWTAILAGTLATAEGRFAAADDAMGRGLAVGSRLEGLDRDEVQNGVAAQMLMRFRERGRSYSRGSAEDLVRLERSLQTFLHAGPEMPAWRAGIALLQVLDGRGEEGRESYETLAVSGLELVPPDAPWSCTMVVATELCVHFGDVERARRLHALLLPHAERCAVVTFGFGLLGSVAHFLGMLSDVVGNEQEADSWFRRALNTHRRLGTQPLLARTQVEYAGMLLRSAVPGGRERAAELLATGAATARRLGMAPLTDQAAALVRTLGP